jgi:Xaa-Pro aminopeptidase
VSERADRLVEQLADAELDALLVTDLVNVRYLTGFTGSNGLVLIDSGTRAFATDFRYVEQAAEEVDGSFERVPASLDLLEAVAELLPSAQPVRLGFDGAHMSFRDHARLKELLGDRAELVDGAGLVERLRLVKDDGEVGKIAAAAAIADEAFEEVLGEGLAGRTERELALALELAMRRRGATRPSFDIIVAGGPHGALPHARPRDVAVQPGELVVFDWGAVLDGYHSDCTRTVAVGEPGEAARDVYGIVREAQLAGLAAVRAGGDGRAVDSVARDIIAAAGHGERFGHGLGHGVGLDIHEAPRLSQRSSDVLVAGSVVTVEPGIYVQNEFGVRIEDLVVVGDDGCRVLTGIDKSLRIVD